MDVTSSPDPGDDAIEDAVGGQERQGMMSGGGGEQPVERVAMAPVHHPGHEVDHGLEPGGHAALCVQECWKPAHEGRHLGPFAEPDLPGDFEEADRADQHRSRRPDGGQDTR